MTAPIALIVEDDPQQIRVFCTAVEEAGYHAHCVVQMQEALHWLAQNAPALVVLDLHLPDGNGETVAGFIRGNPHLQATRIILATASPQRAALLNETADLVLVKPIGFTQLRELAERLLPD